MSKANIVFSPSALDLFLLCKARYNYGHNLRKTLHITSRTKSLDYGGIAHKGLQTYYNALAAGEKFPDRMHKTLMKIREAASDPEESNLTEPEDLNLLLSTIESNLDYWRAEDEFLEVLAVEAPFDYILHEDDNVCIILSGKIDLLVNSPGLGGTSSYTNLPFDHKTYSRDFPVYRLSNQFMAYAVATGSNYLIVNRIGLQKSLKAEEKFKRPPISYDPILLEGWKQNTIKIILDEYLTAAATGNWTMNFTSCYKFNRLCEFYKVCEASGEEAKMFNLESNYVDRKDYDKYASE